MSLLYNDLLEDFVHGHGYCLDSSDPGFAVGFQGFCRMSRLYVTTKKPSPRFTAPEDVTLMSWVSNFNIKYFYKSEYNVCNAELTKFVSFSN